MDNDNLNRLFRDDLKDFEDEEILRAIATIRQAGRNMAEALNKLLPESNSKADIHGRLFRIITDSEMAIRLDGVSRTVSPIVMTRQ